MKLRDLKIGTQLKIGFGIILLLIFLLSTLLWWQTHQLVKETEAMYEYSNRVKQAIATLKYDVLDMRFEYRNFLLATDEIKRSSIEKASQQIEDNFQRQLTLLDERYLGPKSDIEAIRKAYWKWVELRNSNFLIRDHKDFNKTLQRLEADGDVGKARQDLLNKIKLVDDYASKESFKLMKSINFIHKNHSFRLFSTILLTLLLTFIIVYIILRNIRVPLQDLLHTTKQFNQGRWNDRCTYESENEFGELATSYNKLVQLIESELEVKEKANEISKIMLSQDNAEQFGVRLISSLMERMDAQMGALYLLNEAKSEYHRFVSVGMNTEEDKPLYSKDLNGLFGMTLSTGKLQHIKQIPESSTLYFSTPAGRLKPKEILTLPVFFGTDIVAIISLFTIKEYSENSIRLIESLRDTISARLNSILTYGKVLSISDQLEQQNAALEEQKSVLSKQNQELELQKLQLDEANKLKTIFLSNMSHELRTPLNSVIALSGLLNRSLNGKVPEKEYQYLDVIERNGKQLLTIINSILDLSRIESGKEVVTVTTFDPADLIREIVETIEPQAMEKGISLAFKTLTDPIEISSDYKKCFHIVQNLLSNAVKFTLQGGVTVHMEKSLDHIKISVSDTGIGIPDAFIPHIFEEFRQADESHSRNNGGTGLGLAIAQKYAHMLGGNIQVTSTLNQGSVFSLFLPVNLSSMTNSCY